MPSKQIRVPLSRPDVGALERRRVAAALARPELSQGPEVAEFERRIARLAKTKHAVAVSSGTAALHLTMRWLGVGPGDEVVTTPFSFVASANAILFERGTPVFVDISEDDLNLDPARIERAITPKTKAILVVDAFGHPARMDEINEVARAHSLAVIEDSCEALGARYKGRPAGSLADVGAFAFYPNKQITTGEGGILVTNDAEQAALYRSLRNQGRGATSEWLAHERLGYNYRLDELSAALGNAQLQRFREISAKRGRAAAYYARRFNESGKVRPPTTLPHVQMSWFVYVVQLPPGVPRDRVQARLARRGIQTRPYFTPIHLQPFYRDLLGHGPGSFRTTEAVSERTLALPFYTAIRPGEQDRVVEELERAVGAEAR